MAEPYMPASGYNISSAIAILNVCRRTLYNLIEVAGVSRKIDEHGRINLTDEDIHALHECMVAQHTVISYAYVDGTLLVTTRHVAKVINDSPQYLNRQTDFLMSGKKWLDAQQYVANLETRWHHTDAVRLRVDISQWCSNPDVPVVPAQSSSLPQSLVSGSQRVWVEAGQPHSLSQRGHYAVDASSIQVVKDPLVPELAITLLS